MTASEPLTLEEEYAMQHSWHEDENKCTFIILALPTTCAETLVEMSVDDIKKKAVMIGDVNIFLNDPDDNMTFGEIEIMIAEEGFRRGGHGLEALKMMMSYGLVDLGLRTFHAKISLTNQPSIDLFKTKLKFYEIAVSSVFQETTLEWSIQDAKDAKDEEEAYGSKATTEQRENIHGLHDLLTKFWHTNIRKGEYESK
ncbi:N-acetyltransferase 9 [Apophysomyces sp. BC1034]|nr:N-acetyltransferase 9 [Apophysomyces sp. BC1015]KAG0181299.1 N-acetyltransferase 9 [Apophysomyces sp. BC1021]KAG0191743.1 N-acetyltransferase 9 [Apophysomyces sp. BC1034]